MRRRSYEVECCVDACTELRPSLLVFNLFAMCGWHIADLLVHGTCCVFLAASAVVIMHVHQPV